MLLFVVYQLNFSLLTKTEIKYGMRMNDKEDANGNCICFLFCLVLFPG